MELVMLAKLVIIFCKMQTVLLVKDHLSPPGWFPVFLGGFLDFRLWQGPLTWLGLIIFEGSNEQSIRLSALWWWVSSAWVKIIVMEIFLLLSIWPPKLRAKRTWAEEKEKQAVKASHKFSPTNGLAFVKLHLNFSQIRWRRFITQILKMHFALVSKTRAFHLGEVFCCQWERKKKAPSGFWEI